MSETPPARARPERRLSGRAPHDAKDLAPHDEEAPAPRFELSTRNILFFAAFLVLSIVALYYLLPQLAGLEDTWERLHDGDPWWLALALLFAVLSFGGYVALFRGIFVTGDRPIDWRASYQITMAGLAATRLFAAGGAGGIVLTAWALRQTGMARREVADKSITFLVLQYAIYMLSLVIFGFGLHWGIFEGSDPFAFTAVPAVIGVVALAVAVVIALVPTDLQRRLEHLCERGGRIGRWAQRLANVPASASAGLREAWYHVRRRDPALAGAVAFWAFQILTLWAAFHAFGDSPPFAVLVLGFFVGMFGNLLPMPGGVGGVEGGMIGSFAAFGVDAGLAVVAVLVYRAFVFWLPTLPGAIAYFQLRKTVEGWRRERGATTQGTAVA